MEQDNTNRFLNVPVMWEPTVDSGNRTKKFMKLIEEKYKIRINDYWDLHKWSIENLAEFWGEYWHFSGLIYSKSYDEVIDLSVPMSEPQEWFPGAEMNFAENVLKYRDDHLALIVAGEGRETEQVTYAEMYEETKLYAAALKKYGVTKGDRVSCYMSNRKEAVLAMLGTTSLGAIFAGVLPFLGSKAALNRFNEVQPKILFTVDRFSQKGIEYNMLPTLKEISESVPYLEKIIIVASKPESKLKDITGIKNSCFLDDFLNTGKTQDGSVPDIVFEQVPFTHPVFITYTSGTTGLPKALIHSSGVLLTTSRDYWLCCNSVRKDRWLNVSPAGWVSWTMFTTILFTGVTVVLLEDIPNMLWDTVDELQITHMWAVPSKLDDYEQKRYVPGERNHLKSLKILFSGGSTVKPRNFDFVYKQVKSDIIFFAVFGCTEANGLCMSHDQTLRIYRGEIPAPSLGVDLQCVNDRGESITGEIGNLVITKPVPSLLDGMWGDADRTLFKKTYYGEYPGKFLIGDYGIINPITRGIIPCGRCDDIVKQGLMRISNSEIYDVVFTFPEILDSICVSQRGKEKDERVVLFLKMKSNHSFNENLVQRIRSAIIRELSINCAPDVILETEDIPYNMNGKKLEAVVRKIINKMPFNPDTVRNPECLEYFRNIPELQDF